MIDDDDDDDGHYNDTYDESKCWYHPKVSYEIHSQTSCCYDDFNEQSMS